MNQFDKDFKSLVDSYEASYSVDSWAKLEKDLPKPKLKPWYFFAASVIIFAVISFVVLQDNSITDKTQNTSIQEPVEKSEPNNVQPVEVQQQSVSVEIPSEAKEPLKEPQIIESGKIIKEQLAPEESIVKLEEEENQDVQDIKSDRMLCVSENKNQKILAPEFSIKAVKGCPPFAIVADVKGIPESYKVSWLMSDDLLSDQCELQYVVENSGSYDLALNVLDDQGQVVYTKNERIEVYETPTLDYTYEEEDGLITIDNQSTNYKNIEWIFSGIKTSEISPSFEMLYSGVYKLDLVLKNSDNCISEQSEIITYEVDHQIFAPNAFSPDEDGLNDEFKVKYNAKEGYKYTLQIFDATGKMLFESSEKDASWKGEIHTDDNNKPNSKYLWRLIVEDPRGYKVIKEGYFSQL